MSSSLGRTAVVTIADLEKMDVETDISESLLSRIAARASRPRSPSARSRRKRYRGRLRQVHPDGRPDPRHRQGQGRDPRPRRQALPRAGRDGPLPAQQVGRAAPTPDRSYLFVPKSAVFQENGHDFVWVIGAKRRRSSKRRVEVATTNDDLARVESGLEAGESVVLNPIKALRDNEIVRIAE